MAPHPARAFVLLSLALNGGVAMALAGLMAFGIRPVTVLGALTVLALLCGFLHAVGDLIEAELPLSSNASDFEEDEAASEPVGPAPAGVDERRQPPLDLVRHRRGDTPTPPEDFPLSAFDSEQQHARRGRP